MTQGKHDQQNDGFAGLAAAGHDLDCTGHPARQRRDTMRHDGQQRALDAALSAIVDDTAHPLASLSVLAIRHGKVSYQQQFWLSAHRAPRRRSICP